MDGDARQIHPCLPWHGPNPFGGVVSLSVGTGWNSSRHSGAGRIDQNKIELTPLMRFSYITDSDRKYHYRHYYREGDLVLWDNRCIVHRATGGYDQTDIRRLHRTTVIGQKDFYKAYAPV